MSEKLTTDGRLVSKSISCLRCGRQIPNPNPVAHCPHCNWQEKRGAD